MPVFVYFGNSWQTHFIKDEMTGYDTEHNEACTAPLRNITHHLYLINEALERVTGINPKGKGWGG